jgi:hypothetical protein
MALARDHDFGRKSAELADRVKAMLAPLEDVCRYREQRSADVAQFDATPRNKASLRFSIVIAPGGVNIDTAVFSIRELPITEAGLVVSFVEALLAGRVRRVARLSASGKTLASRTVVLDAAGRPLYRNRKRAGMLAGLSRAASYSRERFQPYRSGSA